MKTYKKIVSETTVPDTITCDICKYVITVSNFRKAEVKMSMDVGDSYPETGSGAIIEYDVCVACFKNYVMPTMEQFGAKPTVTEWDY